MDAHTDVVQAAKDLWIEKTDPPREYLNGFIRGYREAEVGLPKSEPKGSKLLKVAYQGGYEYSARIHDPCRDRRRVQKTDRKDQG